MLVFICKEGVSFRRYIEENFLSYLKARNDFITAFKACRSFMKECRGWETKCDMNLNTDIYCHRKPYANQ